jgi:hypothetical protein
LAVVRLLEVLLPPQPENAIANRSVATTTGPSFIGPAYWLAEINCQSELRSA